MKIEIFNVEHGQCAAIYCPTGELILIDAGHNASTGWRPSEHFREKQIALLIISNFDEDHVSDLANLLTDRQTITILSNSSVEETQMNSMKKDGIGLGIRTYLKHLQSSIVCPLGDFGEVQLRSFYNQYPSFLDTNNLSVATFISFHDFTILFPGDLETHGWQKLLKYSDFRELLTKVNILVASHHGRENGYCNEVFNYCKPELVIISDAEKQYDTQNTVQWYSSKVQNDNRFQTDMQRRKVLTTRGDGGISIDISRHQTLESRKTHFNIVSIETGKDLFRSHSIGQLIGAGIAYNKLLLSYYSLI